MIICYFKIMTSQRCIKRNCTAVPSDILRATVSLTSVQCSVLDTRFKIEGELTRRYRRFKAVGTQLTVRLLPPPDGENPVSHFLVS